MLADDNLQLKVTPDGTTFHDALIVDKDTGEVTFPNTTFGGGISEIFHIQDQKGTNTSGGTFTAGAWQGIVTGKRCAIRCNF